MKQEMHIIVPDRQIFVNDDKYTSSIKEQETTFLHDHTEYVPFQGCLIYVKGALHPKKGFPTPEAVWAINQVKVVLRESLFVFNSTAFIVGFLLTWKKKSFIEKALDAYNTIANRALKPYMIKHEFLCPTAYNLNNSILLFLNDLGISESTASKFSYIISHIFEYDDAYRYRLQDIATEIKVDKFEENALSEIKRVLKIYLEREVNGAVASKVAKVMRLLKVILKVKSVRTAFTKAFLFGVNGMRYDEADYYWVSMRGDYLYGGLSYEDRFGKLETKPTQYTVRHE